MKATWIVLVAFLIAFVSSQVLHAGPKTLVILDDENIRGTHSRYFKFLEEKGYQLDFVNADDKANLDTFGEWNYDNLVIFAPSSDDLSGITTEQLLAFLDDGRSAIIAASSAINDAIKSLASECNIEFDQAETFATDHFHYDVADGGSHSLLVVDTVPDIPIIFPKKIASPLLFRGVGQDIEEDSPLLISLLHGYTSTYSHAAGEPIKTLHVAGKKTSLVTALQARNNARAIFSGSLEFFSDEFFTSSVQVKGGKKFDVSGNEEFAKAVTTWAFKERGILRASNVTRHRVGETSPPEIYTIKEEIDYSIEIEEWNGKKWIPYKADDIQLEFSRIDPHVRTTLKHESNGKYVTRFVLPDVYGVFTFRIEYRRAGYGFLESIERVPVRPFRHNQYERFIVAAYPYYASAFSMMVGLFLVSWVFLYHRDKK